MMQWDREVDEVCTTCNVAHRLRYGTQQPGQTIDGIIKSVEDITSRGSFTFDKEICFEDSSTEVNDFAWSCVCSLLQYRFVLERPAHLPCIPWRQRTQ